MEKVSIPENLCLYYMSNNNGEGGNNENLKQQSDEIREEFPYKCNSCARAFANRTTFEQHQLSEHRDQHTI
jgi:hypothetical protein